MTLSLILATTLARAADPPDVADRPDAVDADRSKEALRAYYDEYYERTLLVNYRVEKSASRGLVGAGVGALLGSGILFLDAARTGRRAETTLDPELQRMWYRQSSHAQLAGGILLATGGSLTAGGLAVGLMARPSPP